MIIKNFDYLIPNEGAIQSQPSGIDAVNTKTEIVKNWLPSYTGRPLAEFGKFILLSQFCQLCRTCLQISLGLR